MILLLLGWLLLYHGVLLWLALRFKDKPWRWWWFGWVLTIGLGLAWFDQLYVRFVVVEHYCKANKEQLGLHQFASLHLKQDQVIWLHPVSSSQVPIAHPKKIEQTYQDSGRRVSVTNVFACRRSGTGHESWVCVVPALRNMRVTESIDFLGVHMATKLVRQMTLGSEIIRQAQVFYWPGSLFFRIFKIDLPVLTAELGCGGTWEDVSMGPEWILEIEE